MVKILNTNFKNLFRGTEQYNDCSSIMLKADDPPLEELDPAILSCGLPAIVLSDIQPTVVAPIRYTASQLQAIRKSTLSFRRPAIIDDPRVAQFAIWKPVQTNQSRRGCRPFTPRSEQKDDRGDDKGSLTKDKPLDRSNGQQKHHNGRENGFVAPRFRRSFEFSSRGQHAIVRSHANDENNGRPQETTVEDEPEWMAAGPTSRLDTIELRGFDDDISPNASLDKATSNSSDPKLSSASNSSTNTSAEKHVSFYDDLQHYEHVHHHQKHRGSSQSRDNDVESVATSNTSSPPPARSTPTKKLADFNNNLNEDKLGAGGNQQKQKSPQLPQNGINVHNFEEFMKFESFLGPDTSTTNSDQSGSRFSKWFRRNASAQNQPTGSSFEARRQAYQQGNEPFGTGGFDSSRYLYDRTQQQQPQQSTSAIPRGGFRSLYQTANTYDEQQRDFPQNDAFKRLIDMVAQNRVKNNMLAQQQFLLELVNKNQQSEFLRRMVMKNSADNGTDSTPLPPRIPTHRELQFHTQNIMQNALLRKKLQDQRKMLQEHNNNMAVAAAIATVEPNPVVQQFVQSVSPNPQRSLSVLNQTAINSSPPQQQQRLQSLQQFVSGCTDGALNSPMFSGGPSQAELSASLQQMLHSQQGQRSGRRFGKGSVTWSNVN